ncbi:hypothetical protein HPB47_008997 [Ixodes persulcatus]|uniref:Uncharacterized protein n=1 Tax=Ixodes persulcatus TaxID=34615 RepID=A0AC60P3B6_IXOPE|nr:hypothetical protein HPB47_008997 [Ixodes persulcatus]
MAYASRLMHCVRFALMNLIELNQCLETKTPPGLSNIRSVRIMILSAVCPHYTHTSTHIQVPDLTSEELLATSEAITLPHQPTDDISGRTRAAETVYYNSPVSLCFGVIPLLGVHGSLRTDPAVAVLNIELRSGIDLVVQ